MPVTQIFEERQQVYQQRNKMVKKADGAAVILTMKAAKDKQRKQRREGDSGRTDDGNVGSNEAPRSSSQGWYSALNSTGNFAGKAGGSGVDSGRRDFKTHVRDMQIEEMERQGQRARANNKYRTQANYNKQSPDKRRASERSCGNSRNLGVAVGVGGDL